MDLTIGHDVRHHSSDLLFVVTCSICRMNSVYVHVFHQFATLGYRSGAIISIHVIGLYWKRAKASARLVWYQHCLTRVLWPTTTSQIIKRSFCRQRRNENKRRTSRRGTISTNIVYAVIAVSVSVFIFFLFPDTRGLSLEEMNNIFQGPEH